jgi:hypothetical protein
MVQGRRSAPIDITLELQEEAGADAPEVEPAGFPPELGSMSGLKALGRFGKPGGTASPIGPVPETPRPGPGPV